MNLLVDTNIVVDVLRKRTDDYKTASLLFALGYLHEFELWISPSQLGDLFYVLTGGGKKSLSEQAKAELLDVLQFTRVCSFGNAESHAALESSFEDLEDALVHQAALAVRADFIITRNQGDFATSRVPAKSPSEFFEWLVQAKGIDYGEVML